MQPPTLSITHLLFDLFLILNFTDVPPLGEAGKSDTLGSTGSARKRGGGAKKAMQANKSALRAPRALCCLTLSNPIRMAALALVEWKYPFVCHLLDGGMGVLQAHVCTSKHDGECPCCSCCGLAFFPWQLSTGPLIFLFCLPFLPTVWPWGSPSHSQMTILTPPTTSSWVSSVLTNKTPWCDILKLEKPYLYIYQSG